MAVGYCKDNEDLANHNVIVMSEVPNHSRVRGMSCLDKELTKIEEKRKRVFEEVVVSSDGCASHFHSNFAFENVFFEKPQLLLQRAPSWQRPDGWRWQYGEPYGFADSQVRSGSHKFTPRFRWCNEQVSLDYIYRLSGQRLLLLLLLIYFSLVYDM